MITDGAIDFLSKYYNSPTHKKNLHIYKSNELEPFSHKLLNSDKMTEHYSECSFFCPILFSVLEYNTFYKIFSLILLEYSITFVSENTNILTSVMYKYIYIYIYI